ncbi:CBU_0592 family membrane protein [Thalassotalea profundi]|uniref:CBU-0592-like domain-containing protein n=1 Tax=Thalassotalea profundi TaxID=2036687 RepID=A0ABQ3IH80_9GAMM|nr:hypothetical protein [Thalassotalea profundi]GHE81437.1 hypothetical protein GCM10011501_07010 [Thalassotalea profundi]
MIAAILGWIGSILYLINHGYISSVKQWNPNIYYGGNLIAALSLVISSLMIFSSQAVVINGFWAFISILLIVKFEVAKIPFSKRVFYLGLIFILAWAAYIGFEYSVTSINFYTVLGWSSSYVFCLSYFLFCSKKLNDIKYLLFNAYAATALLPILWSQGNWPVFSLEVCWAVISVYGLYSRIEKVHLID